MRGPFTQSMIASGVLDGLVLLVFIFRLWIRVRMQRVGCEDVWATIAFVFGILNAVSNWVYLVQSGAGQSSMAAMWIYMLTFTCLVWAVRISIVLSIIRIIPTKERLRISGLTIICFFILTCSAFIVQKAVTCIYTYHAFQSAPLDPIFHCPFFHSLTISELAAGSVADLIAIAYPLYVLRRVTLPQRQLRLLRLLFSSTIAMSVMCSLGTAFQFVPTLTSWTMFVANFQVATCLIVCNLLVVVTYVYRVIMFQDRTTSDTTEKDTTVENSDPRTILSTSQQMTLTTVDLLFSMPSGQVTSARTDETAPRDRSVVLA